MSELSIMDFVNFVTNQPKDKEIDHSTGWHSCAIGEFATSRGVSVADDILPPSWGKGQLRFCIDKLNEIRIPCEDYQIGGGTLYDTLGNGTYPNDDYDISTYGGLSELLDDVMDDIITLHNKTSVDTSTRL